MKTFKEYLQEEDKMIKFRKNVDARRLVPTRSGSKGDGGGAGDGGSGGGGGGGGSLEEGNPLAKLVRRMKSGAPAGVVSPENAKRPAKEGHKEIQKDLKRLSKGGILSYTGPHQGRYKYDKEAAPSSEGSYVVYPGKHKTAKKRFTQVIKALGQRHDQESVLQVDPSGKGSYHYTGGEKKGMTEPRGKIRFNLPLSADENDPNKAQGDTKFKRKQASFTVKE